MAILPNEINQSLTINVENVQQLQEINAQEFQGDDGLIEVFNNVNDNQNQLNFPNIVMPQAQPEPVQLEPNDLEQQAYAALLEAVGGGNHNENQNEDQNESVLSYMLSIFDNYGSYNNFYDDTIYSYVGDDNN